MEEKKGDLTTSESYDSKELPQCKIKRNYSCSRCSYFTQNPRFYLAHLREIHGERIKINNCNLCLYASRHYQKLVRHMKMVHGSTADAIPGQSKKTFLPENVIQDSSICSPLLPPPSKWSFDIDSLSYDLKSSRNTLRDIAALYFAQEECEPILAKMKEADVVEVIPLRNSFDPLEACGKINFHEPEKSEIGGEHFTCTCGHFSKSYAEFVVHKMFCVLSNKNQEAVPLDLSLKSEKLSDSMTANKFDPFDEADGTQMDGDWKKTQDVNMKHAILEKSTAETANESILTEKCQVQRNGSRNSKNITATEEFSNFSHKRVYKCPRCSFWASTASRFHVHIVGHHNKKPFKCSLCAYRSNWRWDITKHIRLRTIRSHSHKNARVIMYGDTGIGHHNYLKYNGYLTTIKVTNDSMPMKCGEIASDNLQETSAEISSNSEKEHFQNETIIDNQTLKTEKHDKAEKNPSIGTIGDTGQPLTSPELFQALVGDKFKQNNLRDNLISSFVDDKSVAVFRCSNCSFKHANRNAVLVHIKLHHQDLLLNQNQIDTMFSKTHTKIDVQISEKLPSTVSSNKSSKKLLDTKNKNIEIGGHSSKQGETRDGKDVLGVMAPNKSVTGFSENIPKVNDKSISNDTKESETHLPFRCGHCHQESNWKHVIQRHCRLKHSGSIRIEALDRSINKNATVYRLLDLSENFELQPQDKKENLEMVKTENVDSSSSNSFSDNTSTQKQQPFKCQQCSFTCTTKQTFSKHTKTHDVVPDSNRKSQLSSNTKKDAKCSRLKTMSGEIKNMNDSFPLKCSFCSFESNCQTSMKCHLKNHYRVVKTQDKQSENLSMEKQSCVQLENPVTKVTFPDDSEIIVVDDIEKSIASKKNSHDELNNIKHVEIANEQQIKSPSASKCKKIRISPPLLNNKTILVNPKTGQIIRRN